MVPKVVIVITCAATDLGSLPFNEGDDCMIRNATALDAMVVNDVAESIIVHRTASKRSIPDLGFPMLMHRNRGLSTLSRKRKATHHRDDVRSPDLTKRP